MGETEEKLRKNGFKYGKILVAVNILTNATLLNFNLFEKKTPNSYEVDMSYSQWTDKEWNYLLHCIYHSKSSNTAFDKFWDKYPNRDAQSIRNKLARKNILMKNVLGMKCEDEKDVKKPDKPKFKDEKEFPLTTEERISIQKLKSKVKILESGIKELEKEALTNQAIVDVFHGINSRPFNNEPDWLKSEDKKGLTGIPCLLLSDIHFDEYVDPAQIGYVNEYNREIATRRIQHTFQTAIDLCMNYMHKPKYEGFVCALGGDILSGNIHDELSETNHGPVLQSAMDVTELLIQGFTSLADTFGKVFVPCVVGNHGRLHKKPRAKNRVKDNYEWIIYQSIAKHFASDKRISFLIPEGSDALFSIYNKTILLTHGDQFRGGSGISGIFSPLFIGQARKQKRQQAIHKPFDIMMMGHWHQYIHTESLIVNSSIKGYDEYAFISNFPYERPSQALFIVHPVHGVIYRMPVLCDTYERVEDFVDPKIKVW